MDSPDRSCVPQFSLHPVRMPLALAELPLYVLLPVIGSVLVAQALFEIRRTLSAGDRPRDTSGATGL